MFRACSPSCPASLVAFLLAAILLNHGLVDSSWPNGPGLTLDESFNIDQGVYLAEALSQHGPLLFTPSVARDVFGKQRYLPDHPPLGRLLLGISHQLTAWLIPGSESTVYNVPAARLGSCLAFGLTVLLMTEFACRQFGKSTGCCVAIMLISMPHLIGHARIAALESATNLAWVAALLPLLSWWTGPKPPSTRQSIISGAIWGLLLLVKVQAILLPPIVILWSAWQFGGKSIRPVACWSLTGALVFFIGWPWLWLDPVPNILAYVGRTADRPTLYCWYFGQRFADKAVPWHFPFVMTLLSLPAWTLAGLIVRSVRRELHRSEQLLVLCILLPLTVFAMPGVPVYDGTRLFLFVFPSIALLAGRGVAIWLDPVEFGQTVQRPSLPVRLIAGLLLTIVPLFWIMQSMTITQYGLLAGGNRGAAALGMEACYWSDALNGDFWRQVPANSTLSVAPVSHQFQLSDIEALVPIVHERNIRLVPYQYDPNAQKGLLLLIHRLADLRTSLRQVPPGGTIVAQAVRDGIVSARLIDTSAATLPELQQ